MKDFFTLSLFINNVKSTRTLMIDNPAVKMCFTWGPLWTIISAVIEGTSVDSFV
eukprot:Pgem_evm2s2102